MADTKHLIRSVYNRRSAAGKALTKLATKYDASNNTNGISLLNRILSLMHSKGIQDFSGVIDRKYVRHEEAPKYQRAGVADASGQRCRFLHVLGLRAYDRFGDIEATAGNAKMVGNTGTIGELKLGSDHLETLDEILKSNFMPEHEQERSKKRNALLDEVAYANKEMDTLFDAITGRPGILDSYRRMLEFGPIQIKGDRSVARALRDPNTFRSDLVWLGASIDKMPPSVIAAYHQFTSAIAPLEPIEAATLLAAVQQFKQEKSESLVGSFRKDVFYLESLDDKHDVFKTTAKPDLDTPFKPLVLIKDAQLPEERINMRKKLGQQFMTTADALSLYRSIPGIQAGREKHNIAVSERYSSSQQFPIRYAAAVDTMSTERAKIHDAKKKEEEVPRNMRHDEYLEVRDAADLVKIGSDNGESARQTLVRLTPMPDAEPLFQKIELVGRKATAGIPQLEKMSLIEHATLSKDDVERIAYTPWATSVKDSSPYVKFTAGRAGTNVQTIHALQQALRSKESALAHGLTPPQLALFEERLTGDKREEFLKALRQGEPIGVLKEGLDAMLALRAAPLSLDAATRNAKTGSTSHYASDPKMNLALYEEARFLFPEQKTAIDTVIKGLRNALPKGLDATTISKWSDVESAISHGGKFYTGVKHGDYVSLEKMTPLDTERRARGGFLMTDPHRILEYILAAQEGLADDATKKAMETVHNAQRKRARGFADTFEEALTAATYLTPAGRQAIDGMHDMIKAGKLPVHKLDALDISSVDAYLQLAGGVYGNAVFAVDVKSEGKKPWIEVWNAFSKKRGGMGTPDRFEWQFEKDINKNRLFSNGVRRTDLDRLMETVASYNKQHDTKLYLALKPAQ